VQTFGITDAVIAISGTYEGRAHLSDPYTGMIAIGAAFATVVGPSCWVCDGLATALTVVGEEGPSN
jgi:thiamine biosynthesis lipoprotein ApbE